MRKVSKVDTHSQATAYGVSAVLLSLPFVALGCLGAGAIFLFHGIRGYINRLRKRKAANRLSLN